MIDKLQLDLEKLSNLIQDLNYEDSKWLKWRLSTLKKDLEDKIKLEEDRLNQDDEIKLPYWTSQDCYNIVKIENVTYVLTKFLKDKDESFNLTSYAYIPHKDGFCSFNVNFLGDDKYGDRIYTYNYFYSTRNAKWSYLSKDYGRGNKYPDKYKEYVTFMLEKFNELPEINGGFNPFK